MDNENSLISKVRNYFSSKQYLEHSIPKLHFDVMNDIESEFNIKLEPGLDRNYKHSTDFSFIIDPNKRALSSSYEFFQKAEKDILRSATGKTHWCIYFKLSLIDNVACYFWNERKLNEKNEVDVNYREDKDIPAEIKQEVKSMFWLFSNKDFLIYEASYLQNEKRDWVNDIFNMSAGYQTNLYDLLFGSLDFYNEAEI